MRSLPTGREIDLGSRLPGIAYVMELAPADGNGSVGAPFQTVAEAVAALLVDAADTSAILLYPGDYSAEAEVNWTGSSLLIGNALGASRARQGTIQLPRMTDIDSVNAAVLQFNGVNVGNVTDPNSGSLSFIDCEIRGNGKTVVSTGGPLSFQNCTLGFECQPSGSNLSFLDCEFDTNVLTATGTVIRCAMSFFNSSSVSFAFSGAAGEVQIDGWTKAFVDDLAIAITNGTYDLKNAVV